MSADEIRALMPGLTTQELSDLREEFSRLWWERKCHATLRSRTYECKLDAHSTEIPHEDYESFTDGTNSRRLVVRWHDPNAEPEFVAETN